jgi:anti-sigma regulatory factor (Ser/Thr protein kinase)
VTTVNWKTLTVFSLPSDAGNEQEAMRKVTEAVQEIALPPRRVERLKTAVAEATMNATQHGNHFQSNVPVVVEVLASERAVAVRITDHGGGQPLPTPETPDLESKLLGLQTPRGWGLFLMSKMVDEVNVTSDATHHTIELVLNLGGGDDERTSA